MNTTLTLDFSQWTCLCFPITEGILLNSFPTTDSLCIQIPISPSTPQPWSLFVFLCQLGSSKMLVLYLSLTTLSPVFSFSFYVLLLCLWSRGESWSMNSILIWLSASILTVRQLDYVNVKCGQNSDAQSGQTTSAVVLNDTFARSNFVSFCCTLLKHQPCKRQSRLNINWIYSEYSEFK